MKNNNMKLYIIYFFLPMKAFQQHEDMKKVEEAHVLLMLRKHIFDQEINCSGQFTSVVGSNTKNNNQFNYTL